MRSPRALVPLLSVCAAAAIVTAAATGASIEGLGGGGPAHADRAAAPLPADVTVNAMSWNVCGGPGCPSGAAPDRLAKDIVERMRATKVGGRMVRTDAVLLQEVCEGQVSDLKKTLADWSWAFAEAPGGGACSHDQGHVGVAIGTDAPLVQHEKTKLPAPDGRTQLALCGDVPSWATRVCVTQFSMSEDAEWRRKEASALTTLAGTGRVLVGGDLADRPGSTALDPLYKAYAECDQSGSSRTGAKTRQNWLGTAVEKTDYLFIPRSASVSCSVPTDSTDASDHRPLSAVVRYQ